MAAATRAVLDTNVLVAAAYNPRSASRHVVEACLAGELTPVLSGALRREYEFILARAARSRPYLERIH
jgi:predicted nucleic acid-binding protein